MNDISYKIIELTNTKGKSAAKMTEALKVLGNGKMEEGITRVAKYFEKSGFVKGSIATLTVVGAIAVIKKLIYDRIKDNSLKSEGEKILKELDEVLSKEEITSEEKYVEIDAIN